MALIKQFVINENTITREENSKLAIPHNAIAIIETAGKMLIERAIDFVNVWNAIALVRI